MALSNILENIEAELERVDAYRTRLKDAQRALKARAPSRNGSQAEEQTEAAPRRRRRNKTTNHTPQTAQIVEYVAAHPGSTAGDISRALGLKRGSVSTRLTQLVRNGGVKKEDRGYSA